MKLESITVENYRQFEKAELTFDEGITILAGANNSGKTSLINLIKNIFVDDKLNYNMSDIPAKNMREWVYPIFQKFFRDRKTEENVEKDLLNVVIPKEETDSTHLMKMTTVKIHVSYNPDMDDIKLFADCIMDLDETKHDFYFMYNFEIVHTQFAREIINNFSKIKHRFAEIEEKKSQYAETTDELIINNIQVKERYLKQLIVSLYIQATIPNVYFCDEDYKNKCKFDETKKFRQLFNFCFIKASRPLDDDESDHSHMLSKQMIKMVKMDEKWNELVESLPDEVLKPMKQILDMHRSWRTAAGHIKDVELTNEIIFTKLVDWNESTDLYTLFLDIALLLIKSEDADAARTALAGVFATLRVEPDYINFIEKMWDSFHYRAKEWILMIYELLWDYREDFHDNMLTILKKHCEDEDFNVSLYSNLLLENYSSDDSFKYIRNSKSYFDEIPNRGHKLFIKKNRPSPWINGYDCVMEQIELLSERLEVDGEHLEKRVADYCDKIPDTVQLIKLGRKWWGCRVVCENPNRSFLRVLYKDWYNHKFDWEEAELGRIVLSASEPYCLLITPQLWTYNNGYLLNPPESFISSSSVEQKKQIHDILFEGVDDTETVLAGGIIDYTHKEEIFGFMVSYFSIPGLPSKYAAYCYERNSRLLLQSRPDFSEQEHYNITLHHNGIESFQGSNIMCGFSKISLDEFHWHINITVNGMRLFNEGGQEIGRFEYYYGQRGNMGNRYISNQPLLQRWVVSKDAVSKARCIVGCPNNIKINHAFDSVIRKYED